MKLRFVLVAIALLGAFATATAQLTDTQKDESMQVLHDIRKLELYNHILPVLLTTDQTNVLMTILEKHRADSKKYEAEEHKFLLELRAEIGAALKAAQDKGAVSKPDVMVKAANLFRAFVMIRKALIDDTANQLQDAMRSKLNEGQVRAASNSFDPRLFDPTLDPTTMSEGQKLEMWIRIVLMDPLSYDIMRELSRK